MSFAMVRCNGNILLPLDSIEECSVTGPEEVKITTTGGKTVFAVGSNARALMALAIGSDPEPATKGPAGPGAHDSARQGDSNGKGEDGREGRGKGKGKQGR